MFCVVFISNAVFQVCIILCVSSAAGTSPGLREF